MKIHLNNKSYSVDISQKLAGKNFKIDKKLKKEIHALALKIFEEELNDFQKTQVKKFKCEILANNEIRLTAKFRANREVTRIVYNKLGIVAKNNVNKYDRYFTETEKTFENPLEQAFYATEIRPMIERLLAEIEDKNDSHLLCDFLTLGSESLPLFKKYLDDAFKGAGNINNLPYYAHTYFLKLAFGPIEKMAKAKYHLTDSQIAALVELRTKFLAADSAIATINEKIKNYSEILLSESSKGTKDTIKNHYLILFKDLLDETKDPKILLAIPDCYKDEFMIPLYRYFISKLSSDTGQINITRNSKLSPGLKERLAPYIAAKMAFRNLTLPDNIKQLIENKFNRLEGLMMNPEIQAYIHNESLNHYEKSAHEIILSPKFHEEVQNSKSVNGLSGEERADLMKLSAYLTKPEGYFTEEDQTNVKMLLGKYQNNFHFKQKIAELSSQKNARNTLALEFLPGSIQKAGKFIFRIKEKPILPHGISKESVRLLNAFFSKTEMMKKNNQEFMRIFQKAEKLLKSYHEDPNKVKQSDKLTRKEIGILIKLTFLKYKPEKSYLSEMERYGHINELHRDMDAYSEKAYTLISTLKEIIEPTFKDYYRDGSILAGMDKKERSVIKKPTYLEEFLNTYLVSSGVNHGAKIFYDKKEDVMKLSHFLVSYENEKDLSLEHVLVSDIWEMDITKLISKPMQSKLSWCYGDQWQKAINDKYIEIERQMHHSLQDKMADTKNNPQRRFAAGLANYSKPLKILGINVKGHKRDKERDYNKIHDQFFNHREFKEEMICSEFVTKSTAAAMVELNRRLAEELISNGAFRGPEKLLKLRANGIIISYAIGKYLRLENFNTEQEFKDAEKAAVNLLKANGSTKEEIEQIVRLARNEVFDLPYSKKERLRAVHPGRMVQLLKDKKCISRKKYPKAMRQLLDVNK